MSIELNGTTGIDFNDGSNQSTSATPYGRKNLIINGDMRIAQRGTSVSGKTTGGYDTVDRFIYSNGGETITEEQSTDVPTGQGFSNSFKATITTANTPTGSQQAYIATRLEGQNLQHLKFGTSSAENLTLSFWIKTNFTDQITLWLWNPDANRHIAYALNVDSANTWQKVTWSIDGDTAGAIDNDNGVGLQLRWVLSAGSDFQGGTLDTSWAAITTAGRYQGQGNFTGTTSNYINITGVQLEVGDAASDFEFMPYDMELARCQRYYEKSFPIETAPSNSFTDAPFSSGLNGVIAFNNGSNIRGQLNYFKVTKRATPTITAYNPSHHATSGAWSGYTGTWNPITSQGFYINPTTFGVYGAVSGASGYTPYLAAGGWAANAEL